MTRLGRFYAPLAGIVGLGLIPSCIFAQCDPGQDQSVCYKAGLGLPDQTPSPTPDAPESQPADFGSDGASGLQSGGESAPISASPDGQAGYTQEVNEDYQSAYGMPLFSLVPGESDRWSADPNPTAKKISVDSSDLASTVRRQPGADGATTVAALTRATNPVFHDSPRSEEPQVRAVSAAPAEAYVNIARLAEIADQNHGKDFKAPFDTPPHASTNPDTFPVKKRRSFFGTLVNAFAN